MKAATRKFVIDRIELDLRSFDRGTARLLARALGPALARALAQADLRSAPARRIDAGRIDITAGDAAQVADGIAQRIVQRLSRKES